MTNYYQYRLMNRVDIGVFHLSGTKIRHQVEELLSGYSSVFVFVSSGYHIGKISVIKFLTHLVSDPSEVLYRYVSCFFRVKKSKDVVNVLARVTFQ